jgi:hypothetical protein
MYYLGLSTIDFVLTGPAEGIPSVTQNPLEYLSWLDDLVEEINQIGYTPKLLMVDCVKGLDRISFRIPSSPVDTILQQYYPVN